MKFANMIFKGIQNQTVEFKIVGYQFPDITTPGDYDSNWLRIYINVKSNLGHWQTVDPALETGEVKELVDWFKDLSLDRAVKYPELLFTEQCIAFTLKNNTPSEKTIRIDFGVEMKPKSAKEGEEYFVDCVFNNEELLEISSELEKELQRTPAR